MLKLIEMAGKGEEEEENSAKMEESRLVVVVGDEEDESKSSPLVRSLSMCHSFAIYPKKLHSIRLFDSKL